MSNTLHASYDDANNRVVLTLDTDPSVTDVTILRVMGSGFPQPLPSLQHCPRSESGYTVVYDWTAPLYRTITYHALFYEDGVVVRTGPPITSTVTTVRRCA